MDNELPLIEEISELDGDLFDETTNGINPTEKEADENGSDIH